MSEQTTHSGADEVLTSIRRMLSDEAAPAAAPVAGAAPRVPAAPALLRLSPALRVTPAAPAAAAPVLRLVGEPEGQAEPRRSPGLAGIEADLTARDAAFASGSRGHAPQTEAEEAPFIIAEPEDAPVATAALYPWGDEPELEAAEEARRDEDILRAMVRDVLREELQGEMGERVTLNIRKIVRAEVARMLAVAAAGERR